MKKVIVSWSSGKDSTLTLLRLQQDPRYDVVGLFTTYVGEEVPFQVTPLKVVQMQADLLGLPLVTIELPTIFPSNPVYQSLIVEGIKRSGLGVEAVAFGDMFCNGIAEYRRSYIEPAGWECVLPLLGEDSSALAQEILARGIQTLVVTTDGQILDDAYCGQWYSADFIQRLPEKVDPCGENGEFHTLVTFAPGFHQPIRLNLTHQERGERFCHQRYQASLCEIEQQLPNRREGV